MDVEHRLIAFRRERERKETIDGVIKIISTPLQELRKRMTTVVTDERLDVAVNCEDKINEDDSLLDSCCASSDVDEPDTISDTEDDNCLLGLQGITKYSAYFVLWVIPYIVLIINGFGAVYFCITALLFIYFNTRTRPKLRNEPSAYSVFNKGCEPIEGALSGEQLEKEIRAGMLG